MATKLSKAQQTTIDNAREQVARARKYETFDEYFINERAHRYNSRFNTPEKFQALNPGGWARLIEGWEANKKGIVLTSSKTETLRKLEAVGLIEIIDIDGSSTRIDEIRVIDIA